jgi:hypothetical protein
MRYFLAAVLVLNPVSFGQSANSDRSLSALVETALARFNASRKQAYGYTFIELWHNQNFDQQGRITTDETAKFESVFIGNLPYLLKIEEDGRPLTGEAARVEAEKYAAAVKARKGMTLEQKQAEMRVKGLTIPVHLNLLPSTYNCRSIGMQTISDRPAVQIDCAPRSPIKPKSQKESEALQVHVQLWIDTQDRNISRYDGTLLAPLHGLIAGSHGSVCFRPIGGVWLPYDTVVRGQADSGNHTRFMTEISYSNFQKFHVDVRVLDGNNADIPAENEGSSR